MRPLVYDVAASLDGYIATTDGDVSCFLTEGDHADAFERRLIGYDTVVMGRTTYEAPTRTGRDPGSRIWPHMRHYVVSSSLKLPDGAEVEVIGGDYLAAIRA